MPIKHKFAFCESSTIQIICEENEDGYGRILSKNEVKSDEYLIFSNPSIRKLIMEMHAVFTSTNVVAKTCKLSATQAVSFSHQYRSVLHRICENDDETSAWALFETLYFCPAQTPLVCDITLWGQQSFTICDDSMEQLVGEKRINNSSIDTCPSYWNTILIHLLCCRWNTVGSLLEEGRMDEGKKRLYNTLRSFQMDWLAKEDTLVRVDEWQSKLRDDLDKGIYSKSTQLYNIVEILLGKESTISSISSSLLTHWWQIVPIIILTRYRSVNSKQLKPIAQKCRSLLSSSSSNVFDALLSNDLQDALIHLSSSLWIAVHLTDLLYHTEHDHHHNESTLYLRRSLLREYGCALFAHTSLWQLGVDYLYNAGTDGQNDLINLLCHLPLDSERTAKRALREAEMLMICNRDEEGIDEGMNIRRRGDTNRAIICIARTMSLRHLKGRRWEAALTWALNDLSGDCIEEVVTRILNSATGEEISHLDLVEQLGREVLRSSSLTLLYNLYRFHRADKEDNKEAALKVLVDTVISPDVPSAFREKLFNELLRFLDNGSTVIDSSSIYSLLELITCHSINNGEDTVLSTVRVRLIDSLAHSLNPPKGSLTSIHQGGRSILRC